MNVDSMCIAMRIWASVPSFIYRKHLVTCFGALQTKLKRKENMLMTFSPKSKQHKQKQEE